MIELRNGLTRLALLWVGALLVSGAYFTILNRVAPEILIREGRGNHSDLFALADKNYRQVRELRWVLPTEEKIRLLDEAVEALEEAARQRPESWDYQWYLGQALYLRAHQVDPPDPNLVERAVAIVTKIWESTGQKWEKPGGFLADYYAGNGQPDQAAAILERLLSVHPESPDLYAVYADLLLAQGRDDDLLALLHRKEEKLSLSALDLDRRARLNLQRGDYPAAIEALNRLVAGGSGDSRRRLLLAGALRAVGDFEGGFRILREFVEAMGPIEKLRPAKSFGLNRYPERIFPPLAYLLLEGRLGPLP